MKRVRSPLPRRPVSGRALAALRARLTAAEGALLAIRSGEVDTMVVAGRRGPLVFTLEGAEHAYRVLIESMNEGALTLTADKTILYANACFARMVKFPLEQVIGGSLRRFLSAEDRAAVRALLKRGPRNVRKIQVLLRAGDGSCLPAQISIRLLERSRSGRAAVGMVVTDMTEPRHKEEMLRALSHRVVQAQEAERGRIALELHDNITQLLVGVLFRSQALVETLSDRDGPAKAEAVALSVLLGQTSVAVERISRNLRPSVLEHLGLGAALRAACTEFAGRASVAVKLVCAPMADRVPPETELALYRILQVALKNVEQHAGATHVTVTVKRPPGWVTLTVTDDGIGFVPARLHLRKQGKVGLGLLSMRERAGYVGGTFGLTSARRNGTEIKVRIPVPAEEIA